MLTITTTTASHPTLVTHAPTVEEQVRRIAAHLRLTGALNLSPMEPRKNGTRAKDFRVQRYDTNDAPTLILLAQPGSAETCYLWRLQFPADTDVLLMYAKFAEAVEEGRHLVSKANGHATHDSETTEQGQSDEEELKALMPTVEPLIAKPDFATNLLVELRFGLAKDQVLFNEEYARVHLAAINAGFVGLAAGAVLRAMCKRLLLNTTATGEYRLGARGSELLAEYDRKRREIEAEEAAEEKRQASIRPARFEEPQPRVAPPPPPPPPSAASAPSVQSSARTLKKRMSREWVQETPQQEQASNNRVSVIMQKPEMTTLIMRYILAHEEWTEGEYPTLKRMLALDAIEDADCGTENGCDVGRVLRSLGKRGYFEYFAADDVIQINPSGLNHALACRERAAPDINPVLRGEKKPRVSKPAPSVAASAAVPAAGSFAVQIRALSDRVQKFEEAKSVVDKGEPRLKELTEELASLEAKVKALKDEQRALETSLADARPIAEDPAYAAAAAELADVKAALGMK